MINLLPAEARRELARERFGRLLMVVAVALLGLSISGAGLLFLTFVSLGPRQNELARELEVAKKSPALLRVEEVEGGIGKLNGMLRAFSRDLKRENKISHILEKVISARTSSVTINEINYTSPAEFNLSGRAGARNDLIKFIERIETSDFVDKVNSPISNLLEDRDIDFTLSFTVHSESLSE